MSFDAMVENLKCLPDLIEEVNRLRQDVKRLQYPDKISFNIEEAADALGVSHQYIYKRVKDFRIAAKKDGKGGRVVIPRDELMRYIESLDDA